jgi:hypothetical protein
MKCRIKIIEQKNGDKRYVPQVRVIHPILYFFGMLILDFNSPWENIVTNPTLTGFDTSKTMSQLFYSEEQAQETIDEYKKFHEITEGKKTKRVKYKIVD